LSGLGNAGHATAIASSGRALGGENKTAPGGDTGAVSLAKRLRSAAEWYLFDAVGHAIAAFIERVRQQMRVFGNLAMDLL
jgi:hypothetical protein